MGLESASWISLSGAAPPVDGAAAAYSARMGQVVLFGGFGNGSSEPAGELWSFGQESWAQVNSATRPPARVWGNLAYDATRNVLVLFGGLSRVGTLLNDTWEWDGNDWQQITTQIVPPARASASMAYHDGVQRIVLFGGHGRNGRQDIWFNDTWLWDGQTWEQAPAALSPSGRAAASSAYDSARQQLVLFGGATGTQLSDTWEWDGNAWAERSPIHMPPPRADAGMAFLNNSGVSLLFGGESPSANPATRGWSDAWAWDGNDWSNVQLGTSPGAGPSAMTAYDPNSGAVVHVQYVVVKAIPPTAGQVPQPTARSATWLLPNV